MKKSNNNPLFSIVVITYNQQNYIEQTLKSAINQKVDFNFEIIISDDCSTDKTQEIIQNILNNYKGNYIFNKNSKNLGVFLNYKKALNLCKGKYISTLPGDDYWQNPNRLQLQKQFFDKNPDCGLVHSDCDILYTAKNKLVKNHHKINRHNILTGNNIFEKLLLNNLIIAQTVCFKKLVFDKHIDLDYYNTNFMMEDYPMWLELSKHTKFGYIDESLATYRIIDNSLGHPTTIKKRFAFLESYFKVKQYFINKYGCSNNIQKQINEEYHLKRLKLAFATYNKDIAFASFNSITQKKFDYWFYYMGSKSKLINKIVLFYFKLKNRINLI